ncbi:uncharacterized protein LOC128213859 [Mya arenaria]|uniref:uncharacterized protein LOC128213859 n=1 Tax=Mya arenaria TaxID=6604 RepID=UPI0022E37C78|nr:uncharacterized protein LOC128213859 [Mya arenaria]
MDEQNKNIAWLSVHDIQKEPNLCSSVDFANGPDRIWANSTDTWGNEKIASTIQNIVERKINAENKFQSSPTSEEILAGLRFQDVRNIYIESDCHLCSHYTSVSLPAYEHLNDGKNQIQSAYYEAADGRQRRLSGGSAWGDQEVRFNNPFDPRLRFDGLTPCLKRKHVDSENRPVLDDMNSLIMTQDPVEFADTYYSKYRMYVNDLQNGGDLSSGGDVFGRNR